MPEAADDLEVEWQFDALDLRPVERWLAEIAVHSGLDGEPEVAVEARPARRLVDSYLDTTDWRLGRAGYVVRVRRRAGGSEATLKDMAEASGGLRRRLEVTEPLPDDGLAGLGHEGPVGRRLHALVGSRPLREVLEVRTRRRPYTLRIGSETAGEIALDDTVIAVADGAQPVRLRRVEVEVDPAWVQRSEPLVGRLRAECGLQPATLSKFEAGLLTSGQRIPPPPDLGPTALSPSPTVGEVAYAVLRRNMGVMLAHEAGTRLGEDPEELHDMRVATRRMRAALGLFAEALPARAPHVRDELGWLAEMLGAVRDLDVQLERVEQWMGEVPEEDRAALADLAALLGTHRRAARAQLLAALESHRYERLVSGFSTMLRQGPSRRSVPGRAPAVMVVPDLVRGRHRAVAKAARRARRSGEPADFHRLRIRCKRLRYALEFVSEIYPGQTGRYVKQVVAVQDTLGLMQDASVAAERLHAMVRDEGSQLSRLTIFVMGGVAERYRHESARLMAGAPKHLDALWGPKWQRLIAHLDRRRLEASPWQASTPAPPRPTPAEALERTAPPAPEADATTPQPKSPVPRESPVPQRQALPTVAPRPAPPASSGHPETTDHALAAAPSSSGIPASPAVAPDSLDGSAW